MKRDFFATVRLLAAIGLASCASSDTPDDAVLLRDYDVESYELRGELDWQARRFDATVRIRLQLLDTVASELVLDSGVEVKNITLANGAALPFRTEVDKLIVDLSSLPPASREQPIELEIGYNARSSLALRVVDERTLAPERARVFFTNSEPEDAKKWLPCHNLPADRATFRASLTLANGESMVGNGLQVSDVASGPDKHVVTYAIDRPIPNYLMAFAAGELVHQAAAGPGFGLEVWHRADVEVDKDAILQELYRQATELQARLGSYPFERYALVFLPDFSGGMENASATFQGETQGTSPGFVGNRSLTAHEFAHQWFGDKVTVRTWDDVWIKEGLATHLAAEILRDVWENQQQPTLLGSRFGVAQGAAIYDTAKQGLDKYDSGPYGRAAWLFSQIRASVGDDAFYAILRSILIDYADSSISTDAFVARFSDKLGAPGIKAVKRALVAKDLPAVAVEIADETRATLTLTDDDDAMIVGLELEWVDHTGTLEKLELKKNQSLTLKRPHADALLVIDPRNVHPYTRMLGSGLNQLAGFRTPQTPIALTTYLTLPGSTHDTSADLAVAAVPPEDFANYLNLLHSELAPLRALEKACEQALLVADNSPTWRTILSALLAPSPPSLRQDGRSQMSSCSALIAPDELFAADLQNLRARANALTFERINYLAKFNYADTSEAEIWGNLVLSSPEMRVRKVAMSHLARRASSLTEPTRASVRALIQSVVRDADALELARSAANALPGLVDRENPDAAAEIAADLAALAVALVDDDRTLSHSTLLCTAYELFEKDDDLFQAWVARLPTPPWSASTRAIALSPARCN